MSKPFPPRFSLAALGGPRARQFTAREDAFQQLIGDGLRAVFGLGARVSATEGRDGSIDAFVEPAPADPQTVLGLPAPVIVECKDHDDALPGLARNVEQGWRAVERKLGRQADDGWPGTYAPWREPRGYLYCVSAVLTENGRRELEGRIRDFFNGLPPTVRPPLQAVRVCDWSDLREWLDGFPRVADRWMGVGLERLVGHEEFEAGLSGFLGFLQDAQLPFVPPAEDAPFHPDRLLARLRERSGDRGVVLVGPGGVGKTRTALEVARRAHASGWRVLHALPAEPGGLTADQLAAAVLPAPGPTLVVFDYLDQMGALDLGAVRRVLLPQATERGVELALLANSRPAWMQVPRPERDALLERVGVEPDAEQRGAITRRMLDAVAPRACAILGFEVVARACGVRPIIALIIAGELERRAREGLLGPGDAALRPGDLVDWLMRRFQEDGLRVAPSPSALLPSRPEPHVVAAAAALAAAPQVSDALIAAAGAAFRAASAAGDAAYLVDALQRLGWLEPAGTEIAVAHDAVADELLKRVALSGVAVREEVLEAVLAAGTESPRTAGRLAVSLDRLGGDPAADPGEGALRDSAAAWLHRRADAVGGSLAEGRPDEASYALGAILRSSVWGDTALAQWDAIVAPWLARHGASIEARHLLYIGLRSVPTGEAGRLVETALAWLNAGPRGIEASFVLGPLLDRRDLAPAHAADAIRLALAWLRIGSRRTIPQALYVLRGLLARPELDDAARAEAIQGALEWVERGGPDTRALLLRLLERPDVREENLVRLVAAALVGLRGSDRMSAQDVGKLLMRLLRRDDISPLEAEEAVRLALAWLREGERGTTPEAHFVLHVLLDLVHPGTPEAAEAIERGLAWLRHEGQAASLAASYIYPPLLDRHGLVPEVAAEVIARAATWLREGEQARVASAGFILSRLLDRPELSSAAADEVIGWALAWLEEPGHLDAAADAGFILPRLLRRPELAGPNADRAVDVARAWLRVPGHALGPNAPFVLQALLSRPELPEAEAPAIARRSRAWLAAEGQGTSMGGTLLRALLACPALPDAEIQETLADALSWLTTDERWSTPGARYVLQPMLAEPSLRGEALQVTADHALLWLRCHGQGASPRARAVLPALINRRDLDAWTAAEAVGHALTWLWQRDQGGTPHARPILLALLNRSDLAAGEAAEAISHALGWLRHRPNALQPEAAQLHRALLERADLDAGHAERAIGFALAWLSHGEQVMMPGAAHVAGALLARPELEADTLEWLADAATRWLDVYATRFSAYVVLTRMLQSPALAADAWLRVAELSLQWVAAHPEAEAPANYVLIALLTRPELLSPDHAREVRAAGRRVVERGGRAGGRSRLRKRLYKALGGLEFAGLPAQPALPALPARPAIVKRPPSLPAERFPRFVERLNAAVTDRGARGDSDLLKRALADLARHAADSPGFALFAVPPLLAIAAHQGPAAADLALSDIIAVLEDPRLTPRQRRGLAFACLRTAREMDPETVPRFCALVQRAGIEMGLLLSPAEAAEYAAFWQV